MISGGVVPTGNCRTAVCDIAVTWASDCCRLALGWKKTLVMARPSMIWVSVCSMSLTVVVRPRSVLLTIRSAISWAEKPENCQIMLMTGILMSGKISTGVRRITNGVRIRTSSDATINVYGRLSAKRTIHIYIKVLGLLALC